MCAARYMHTAEAHAGVMLGTVRGLAAGMGAVESKAKEGEAKVERKVGNAVLGLWVGLRLYGTSINTLSLLERGTEFGFRITQKSRRE